ncbi:MAG: polysaccharide deacetylase [Myxococcales bacterium]|nr:polysaccharide deacetylase [Myxococcales bacterium]
MEVADPAGLSAARVQSPPALLVSLHDVSPLTLADCDAARALLGAAGIGPEALTVLVVPRHEGRVAVDEDAATVRFLRGLADDGATLVMHGLSHRMPGRAWSPLGFVRGHVFARGQGELLRATAAETTRALDEGAAILRRAGLEVATRAFVPPAWLLSRAARDVISRAGFDFYELFAGIVVGDARPRVPRVIGWGSLNGVEAVATDAYARLQTLLPVGDTRVAVHPADMRRPAQRRSIAAALARLTARARPQSYAGYLGA